MRRRALDAGVTRVVTCGYDLPSSHEALRIAQAFGDAAAVGVHPHDAPQLDDAALLELAALARAPHVVAVGEIGLDFHYDHSPRETQEAAFRAQLRLAAEAGLPVLMHCRDAYPDLLRILREDEFTEVSGVAHCFFGSPDEAMALVDLGYTLGVGGGVTFPKSEALRQTLLAVPRDRIVLETDCPYMAPVPRRGKRNEPAYLPLVAQRLAELFEAPVERIALETTANALRLMPRLAGLPEAVILPPGDETSGRDDDSPANSI